MKSPLHVLHIEDCKEDSELIFHLLQKDGVDCQFERIETRAQVFDALQKDSFDLILADCKLPGFSGLQALEIAHALKPEIPFVFVSGTIGEETAIESLRNGATDYVLKDHLSGLAPAVRRALTEATERTMCRQLQHRLREAARLEAVSTLSNGIAHDFNNILTIILGHASLLTMEYDRPDRVLEITETIAHAARRASEVVQQLLAFAHQGDGHGTPTELNRRVQETLALLKGTLPQKIDLVFEPGADLPTIIASASQLERMIMNLVSNAAEAMPEGGRITLSTRLVSSRDVPNLLPELSSEDYLCLNVADSGVGMDMATQEHAFEPFYTTKERGRGTGLGLPVVYGLMQAHRGVIHIESEPGKGATVSLFFPVHHQKSAKKSLVSHLSDPALSGSETILVVEDESDVSFFLETVFTSHGYNVLVAHDHDQALAHFKTHGDKIALVFSDIGLPKMDGIAVCTELKRLKPDLRIILSSGYAPGKYQERMDALSIDTFLPKPYNTHTILKCVRKILDGASIGRTA
jgi:two-component system cell cycle sensor histidine kinase/response regulator CckA